MTSFLRYIVTVCLAMFVFVQADAMTIEKDSSRFVTHVTVVVYHPVKEQTEGDPTLTASGIRINVNKLKSGEQRIVAISRDLLPHIPLKSVIDVEGMGRFVVADKMGPRQRMRLDVCMPPGTKGFKKNNVKVTLVSK